MKRVPCLVLIAAMTLAFPALARDLIVIDGPIKAKDVKCRGCVDTRDLDGNAVTKGKLGNDAVTSGKIADGAVRTNEIQNLAVTTGKIADGAVTVDKLAVDTLAVDADANEIAPFRVLRNPAEPVVCIGGDLVIRIDNTGVDEFVVTSIMIRTSGVGAQQSVTLRILNLAVNGFVSRTVTRNLVGPTGGQGAFESADLMGTPLIFFADGDARSGTFPHQIVASALSDGDDIEVRLICDFDSSEDFSITAVAVSGWKYTDDTVTVDYFVDE